MTVRQIDLIAIDGGAKTSKSTVCEAVANIVGQHKGVMAADAGRFIRQITAATLDFLQIDGRDHIVDEDLDRGIEAVVQAGTAFNPDYPWGNLESPEINRWVSVVGSRPIVQQEKLRWYEELLTRAREEGTEVLVINARNPRQHMARWTGSELRVRLELFTDCDPLVAAKRKLLSHGVAQPTPEQLAAEGEAITARRELDVTRPVDAFVVPQHVLEFVAGADPAEVIAQSWQTDPAKAPLPIRFDTTNMTKDQMIQAAQSLALAALDFDTKN